MCILVLYIDNNVLYFITQPPICTYILDISKLHFKCSFFLFFFQAIRQEFVIPKNNNNNNPGTKNKYEEQPEELISRPTKDNHLKEASTTTATTLADSKQPENHSSER